MKSMYSEHEVRSAAVSSGTSIPHNNEGAPLLPEGTTDELLKILLDRLDTGRYIPEEPGLEFLTRRRMKARFTQLTGAEDAQRQYLVRMARQLDRLSKGTYSITVDAAHTEKPYDQLEPPEATDAANRLGERSADFYKKGGIVATIVTTLQSGYDELRFYEVSQPFEAGWITTVEQSLEAIAAHTDVGHHKEVVTFFLARLENEGMSRERTVEVLDMIDSMLPGGHLSGVALRKLEAYALTLPSAEKKKQFLERCFSVVYDKAALQAFITTEVTTPSFQEELLAEVETALSGGSIENLAQHLVSDFSAVVGKKEKVQSLYGTGSLLEKVLAYSYRFRAQQSSQESIQPVNDAEAFESFVAGLREALILDISVSGAQDQQEATVFFEKGRIILSFIEYLLAEKCALRLLYAQSSGDYQLLTQYVLAESLEKTDHSERIPHRVNPKNPADTTPQSRLQLNSDGTFSLAVSLTQVFSDQQSIGPYLQGRTLYPDMSFDILGTAENRAFMHDKLQLKMSLLGKKSLHYYHGWGATAQTGESFVQHLFHRKPDTYSCAILPNYLGFMDTGVQELAGISFSTLAAPAIDGVAHRSLRTHALSLAPTYAKLLGGGKHTLFGHSMGGRLGTEIELSSCHPSTKHAVDFEKDPELARIYAELITFQQEICPEKTIVLEPVTSAPQEKIRQPDLAHLYKRELSPEAKEILVSCGLLMWGQEGGAPLSGTMTGIIAGRNGINAVLRKLLMQIGGATPIPTKEGGTMSLNDYFFSQLVSGCPADIAAGHRGQLRPDNLEPIGFATTMLLHETTLTPHTVFSNALSWI